MGTSASAVSAAQAGDTITFRGGSYAGGITISRPNVTLRSHPGEWAVLSAGSADHCVWFYTTGGRVQRLVDTLGRRLQRFPHGLQPHPQSLRQ